MATAAVVSDPVIPKVERSHLPVILAIAIVARIVTLLVYAHGHPIPDLRHWGYENIYIALSVHDGHGYGSPFLAPSGPTAFMTPIYPLLIACFIEVFGVGSLTAWILIIFQILLSVITLLLVMRVTRDHFGIRTANLAGFIFALCQPTLRAPLYIDETCLSALLLLAAVAVTPHLERRASRYVAAGLGCAIAILVNPALLFVLLGLFGWSAWRARIFPWLGIFVFLVAYSVWPIRNFVVMHSWIPLRTNFGYELWLGNHPGADGESPPYQPMMVSVEERNRFINQGEVAYLRTKGSLARAYILGHPAQFADLSARRFARFWLGSSKSPSPLTPSLALLGLAGLALLWRRRQAFTLFAIPLVIYPLPYYITHADVRYQFVIDPLLAVLAGYACECLLAFIDRRPLPVPARSGAIIADQPSA